MPSAGRSTFQISVKLSLADLPARLTRGPAVQMASQQGPPPVTNPDALSETRPPPPKPPLRRPSGSVTASVAAAVGKPSPFPSLDLMLDHRSTVSHALAQSVRVARQKERTHEGGKAEDATAQTVEWAPGERRVKAGLSPGQAARKVLSPPSTMKRAYRRFFIKHDLKHVRRPPSSSSHFSNWRNPRNRYKVMP